MLGDLQSWLLEGKSLLTTREVYKTSRCLEWSKKELEGF